MLVDDQGQESVGAILSGQTDGKTWIEMAGCLFDPADKSEDSLQYFQQNVFQLVLHDVVNPTEFKDTDPFIFEVFNIDGLSITSSDEYVVERDHWREKVSTTLRIDTTVDEFE